MRLCWLDAAHVVALVETPGSDGPAAQSTTPQLVVQGVDAFISDALQHATTTAVAAAAATAPAAATGCAARGNASVS